MVPIVAYNYGARNPERIMRTIKLSMLYATAIMALGFRNASQTAESPCIFAISIATGRSTTSWRKGLPPKAVSGETLRFPNPSTMQK